MSKVAGGEEPEGAARGRAVFRFGDFELDVGRYELRRLGNPVKVEKLPFELLRLLVEREGLLVTREEIAARLWDRTHGLDVEQGINTAVRKARQALEPSPELLGTVVGRGYRFEAEEGGSEKGEANAPVHGALRWVLRVRPASVRDAARAAHGGELRTG